MKYLFYFIVLYALPFDTLSQPANLKFQAPGIITGLTQSNVTCILQDSRGFMWFGTRDGLDRYDGYEYTVYRNQEGNSQSVSNNFISAMIEDSKGYLWICHRPTTGHPPRHLIFSIRSLDLPPSAASYPWNTR